MYEHIYGRKYGWNDWMSQQKIRYNLQDNKSMRAKCLEEEVEREGAKGECMQGDSIDTGSSTQWCQRKSRSFSKFYIFQ